MDDLLNDTPCGFLRFTDDGTVLATNATLLDMLGHEPGASDKVLGRHIGMLLSPGGRVFYQTHFFPLLKLHGRADEVYLSLRSVTGEDVPVLVNAVRREQGGDGGTPVNDCILVTMRQRSLFEDEILRAKKAAEEATREKERAFAALTQVKEELEEANVELEAQREELQAQQEALLELNARLQARAEREALLNRIGHMLRTQGEPEKVLGGAVAALSDALGVDRCYFVEYDIARDWARVSTEWHRPDLPSLIGTYRISDYDLDIAEVYGSEGLVVTRDLYAGNGSGQHRFSPKAAAALNALGVRSGMGVAVFDEGVPVASLNVVMAEAPRTWTPEEVELLQEVATLTWAASEEARLHEKEHRIAEYLQAALQPPLPLPEKISGMRVDAFYRPALNEASVGGDFYDVFPLGEGCCVLVVADLSGKGLQAASQVATVRHMLRAHLYQDNITTAQALTALNRMLTEHDLINGFATLFVGAYDANQRTLVYVNAGQEPGLLRRGDTPEDIEELGPTGPVLGGFPGATFEERTIPLAAGDVLALFTDGLTEAGPSRKDQLEVSGVADIFRESTDRPANGPREITARVMQRVEARATPLGIKDDVCLLVACID